MKKRFDVISPLYPHTNILVWGFAPITNFIGVKIYKALRLIIKAKETNPKTRKVAPEIARAVLSE